MNISTLGIIPARKGSKGVPNKNKRLLNGIPLVEHTLKAAKESNLLSNVLMSTDCPQILELAMKYNVISNGLRPESLSDDKALTIDVIVYELEKLGGLLGDYSHVMLLQPTCPLRTHFDIDTSINLLIEHNARSLISVVESQAAHPLRMKKIFNNRLYNYIDTGIEDMRPRQILPKVYLRNGAIYLASIDDVITMKTLARPDCMPYIMKDKVSINIDNELDFLLAEAYLNK